MPVRLQAYRKVNVFNAHERVIEPPDCIEPLAQEPEHPRGHALFHEVGSQDQEAEKDADRHVLQLDDRTAPNEACIVDMLEDRLDRIGRHPTVRVNRRHC